MRRWFVDLYWELKLRLRRLSETSPNGHWDRYDWAYLLLGLRPGLCRKKALGRSPKTYYVEHWPLSK